MEISWVVSFFVKIKKIIYVYECLLPSGTNMHYTVAEESVASPGYRILDICEPPYVV